MLNSVKLGFIGAGQMARAIGFPLVQKGKSDNFVRCACI
jgi:pyrroline-5-carboxylate reductase